MSNRFQILALDGGGIKGLFSAAVLAHIEEDLNINIIDHFDIITGTSTGGIIAMGLGIGMRPREIVDFYVSKGSDIFKSKKFSKLKHVFKHKYLSIQLESALKECFKNKCIADSIKRLVIPSYNIGENSVYLFKTPHHKRLRRDYNVPLWKVAMATSAAPTYFPAFYGVDEVRLIDGGVWANNPSMIGIIEAISLLEKKLEQIYVLNLGTTDEVKNYSDNLDTGGRLQWCKAAIDVILQGQSIGVFTQAQHLIGKDHIERLSPKVADGIFALDKLSTSKLIGKASHESRILCPKFEKNFLDHKAEEYKPLYNYEENK